MANFTYRTTRAKTGRMARMPPLPPHPVRFEDVAILQLPLETSRAATGAISPIPSFPLP